MPRISMEIAIDIDVSEPLFDALNNSPCQSTHWWQCSLSGIDCFVLRNVFKNNQRRLIRVAVTEGERE